MHSTKLKSLGGAGLALAAGLTQAGEPGAAEQRHTLTKSTAIFLGTPEVMVASSCSSVMPTPLMAVNAVLGLPSARLRIKWKGCTQV